MSELRLSATVTDDGKLKPDAPTVWAASLQQLHGRRVVVTIERERIRRTTQANAR